MELGIEPGSPDVGHGRLGLLLVILLEREPDCRLGSSWRQQGLAGLQQWHFVLSVLIFMVAVYL